MRTKLVSLSIMLCLVVLAIVGAPKTASACSGDDCGCGTQLSECMAECPPPGDPNRSACTMGCLQENHKCSVCCCCDLCPTYCG
jgi:hypothetical protein